MSLIRMVCMPLMLKVISVMGIVCLPQAIKKMEKACIPHAKAITLPLFTCCDLLASAGMQVS